MTPLDNVQTRKFYFIVYANNEFGLIISQSAVTIDWIGPTSIMLINAARREAQKYAEGNGHILSLEKFWVSFMIELEE